MLDYRNPQKPTFNCIGASLQNARLEDKHYVMTQFTCCRYTSCRCIDTFGQSRNWRPMSLRPSQHNPQVQLVTPPCQETSVSEPYVVLCGALILALLGARYEQDVPVIRCPPVRRLNNAP